MPPGARAHGHLVTDGQKTGAAGGRAMAGREAVEHLGQYPLLNGESGDPTGTGARGGGQDLRSHLDDDVFLVISSASRTLVDESHVGLSCICIAPAFVSAQICWKFFLFSSLCVLQKHRGSPPPLSLSCRGLDEMRGPNMRHQGRPSEIVRPTRNSAEISPSGSLLGLCIQHAGHVRSVRRGSQWRKSHESFGLFFLRSAGVEEISAAQGPMLETRWGPESFDTTSKKAKVTV